MTEHQHKPCWLYHARLGAKVFMTQAEFDEAIAQGWHDSPGAAKAAAEAYEAVKAVVKIEPLPLDLPGSDGEPAPDDGVIEHSAKEVAVIAGANALGALMKEDAPKVVRKKRKRS